MVFQQAALFDSLSVEENVGFLLYQHSKLPRRRIRELVEETGLVNVTLHDIPIKTIGYTFLHEGIRINKQVEYFIGECADQMTAITQPEEVSELRWCTFKEAYDLLLHQNSKEVLKQVEDFLYKQT